MAEDWLDCPVLGPGWKRRESFRKSGITCGRSDTYYQSPTGERIRSKVELTRFLGPECDLSCFDFKRGVLQYLPTKAAPPKKKRKVCPKKAESTPQEQRPPEPSQAQPAPICCESCGDNISDDSPGRQRLKSLCKKCRAQRNAFNREQRMFKRVGCGDCKACCMTEDCGICSACVGQPPRSQCAQRRCLKIIKKTFGCGLCSGCQIKEDCGACRICERKGKPGLKRQWKCLQRRCLRRRIMKRPRGLAARKLPGRKRRVPVPSPPVVAGGPSSTAKECEGPGLGVFISSPGMKQEAKSYGAPAPRAASPSPAGLSRGFSAKSTNRARVRYCVKQEDWAKGEEEEDEEEEVATKLDTPVIMEIYSLSGATPSVTAGAYEPLDSVLQEFLAELNELPLPAHWEVLPPRGPDLCLVQRSPLSTMTAAVIHIQPGLFFHVVVQDVPVPPSHQLYAAHPLRLTTVDEVVELICNLEAYHLCPGWLRHGKQGTRSPDCDVLVYEGRCQACCLKPCPSGCSSN